MHVSSIQSQQAFGETTDIQMPGMSNDHRGVEADNTMWHVWFDILEPGETFPVDELVADKPPFCGPLGCCVPAVHYFSDESAIHDTAMGK